MIFDNPQIGHLFVYITRMNLFISYRIFLHLTAKEKNLPMKSRF